MSLAAQAPALLAASGTTVPDVSVGHLFMQMVIAIAVVGGGIWLFGKFVQRRRAGTLISSKGAMRGLSVLSRTSLGKDHLVAVVAWRERELLIGVSGSTITLLADSTSTSPAESPASIPETDDDLNELMAAVPATRPLVTASRSKNERPNFLEALRSATLRG